MKTFLGSLLASTMQALWAGIRAYFMLSERDARILASAYGFPPPEIEELQDGRRTGESVQLFVFREQGGLVAIEAFQNTRLRPIRNQEHLNEKTNTSLYRKLTVFECI